MIIGTTAIILLWVVFSLPLWANILLTVVAGFWILFCLLFTVYYFNLDMKLLPGLQKIMFKVHDKKKEKNRHI